MTQPTTPTSNASPNQSTLSLWRTVNLLILGMTYPAYSTKYKELVCTGAIDEDTGDVLRIYPMPKRYMSERFKNFQRVSVPVQKTLQDGRPDSIRIDFEKLVPLNEIPHRAYEERRRYLESSPSLARSVEDLDDRRERTGRSLGIIMPKSIERVHIHKRSNAERAEWYATERKLMSQPTLPNIIRPEKKIDFPEAAFEISWLCDDARCVKPHTMNLKSWQIHELYRKLKNDPERDAKTKAHIVKMLDLAKRDVFMFMGTFHNHQTTFGLMEIYAPEKRRVMPPSSQLDLFGGAQ